MIIQEFSGRGRSARSSTPRAREGWLFQLVMRWFTSDLRL
jgi:hypothetical protein